MFYFPSDDASCTCTGLTSFDRCTTAFSPRLLSLTQRLDTPVHLQDSPRPGLLALID